MCAPRGVRGGASRRVVTLGGRTCVWGGDCVRVLRCLCRDARWPCALKQVRGDRPSLNPSSSLPRMATSDERGCSFWPCGSSWVMAARLIVGRGLSWVVAVSAHRGRAACRGRGPCNKHAGDARTTSGATTSQWPPRRRGPRSPPAVLPSGRAGGATSSAVRHCRRRTRSNGDAMAANEAVQRCWQGRGGGRVTLTAL